MSNLMPALEKMQTNFDKLDDTVKSMNLARTTVNRVEEFEEERSKPKFEEKKELSMQELLAEIMSDMGETPNKEQVPESVKDTEEKRTDNVLVKDDER